MSDFIENNSKETGEEIYRLIERLYPICRSITGNGVRETFDIIKEYIPIKTYEIPTGTQVFDWTVPKEWNIKDAYIKNSKGEKIIDFNKSNIHVLNYSCPIKAKLTLAELKEHLFTLEEYPDWIPYLTSYYKENWGFCLTHNQYKTLEEDNYEVVIDSSLENGSLTYGELFIPGEEREEILISTYVCHPSMCNDNLSGPALVTFLAKNMLKKKSKYSYRFLFIPETIGAITWLSLNEDNLANIKCGLVATCVGDEGNFTYKKTRKGSALIDKLVKKVLDDSGKEFILKDFKPFGSDERQFSSPGFNMEIGSLMRTMYACFPQYHTSADNLDFVKPQSLAEMYMLYNKVFFILENEGYYKNLNPKGEPQLGRRGLYNMIGGTKTRTNFMEAVFWILNLSDGENSLLDISIRSEMSFDDIKTASDALIEVGLLEKIDRS